MSDRGYSLLELVLAMTIIALLAGSFVLGSSLIRSAHLRATLNDISQFQTAFKLFKTKYNAAPGDMRNATDYWGQLSAGCAWGNFPQPPSGTKTCNGNGDGQIFLRLMIYLNIPHESFLAWKHLSNAGLIDGNFLGWSNHTAGGDWITLKDFSYSLPNVPAGPVEGSGYVLFTAPSEYLGWYSGYFSRPENFVPRMHAVVVGRVPVAGQYMNPLFSPVETQLADAKMDDGLPLRGKFFTNVGLTGCHTLTAPYSTPSSQVTYKTNSGENCTWYIEVGR